LLKAREICHKATTSLGDFARVQDFFDQTQPKKALEYKHFSSLCKAFTQT